MSRLAAAILIMTTVSLFACSSEEHQDIKLWMNEVTKDMKGRVPPLPEIKPFPIVSYEAVELMDPFNPAKIEPDKKPESSGGGVKPDFNRFKEPLEAYSLKCVNQKRLRASE